MSLQPQIKRLERETGINLPCAVCDEIDRYLKDAASMFAPHVDESVQTFPFTYNSFCAFCGRAETKEARALDAEEAALATFVLTAVDEGRYCAPEVAAARREWSAKAEANMQELLGDGWPEYQARYAEHKENLAVLYQNHKPRFPYVCVVAGCPCEHSSHNREIPRQRMSR